MTLLFVSYHAIFLIDHLILFIDTHTFFLIVFTSYIALQYLIRSFTRLMYLCYFININIDPYFIEPDIFATYNLYSYNNISMQLFR